MSITENIKSLKDSLPKEVTLVAVSKTKPIESLLEAYKAGQRIFGENKIQEMTQKWEVLPKDIEWHMIGHVQTNKVKYMAPYVTTIHAVDSLKLLKEINKQAVLQSLKHIKITGLMGMATFTEDKNQVKSEFLKLKTTFEEIKHNPITGNQQLTTISMGMSGDYPIAIECGSTMIRVGSSIFGARNY